MYSKSSSSNPTKSIYFVNECSNVNVKWKFDSANLETGEELPLYLKSEPRTEVRWKIKTLVADRRNQREPINCWPHPLSLLGPFFSSAKCVRDVATKRVWPDISSPNKKIIKVPVFPTCHSALIDRD